MESHYFYFYCPFASFAVLADTGRLSYTTRQREQPNLRPRDCEKSTESQRISTRAQAIRPHWFPFPPTGDSLWKTADTSRGPGTIRCGPDMDRDSGLQPNEVLHLVEDLYLEYPGEVLRAACRAEIDERDEIGSLIYGEVGFVALSWILKAAISHVKPHSGSSSTATFYDLGSGSGRMVLSAALLQPSFRKCAGIEIIHGLHNVAEAVLGKYDQMRYSLPESHHDQTIQLTQGDFLQADWSDATVVLVNSTCFTPNLMMALEERAAELLRFGSVIVTFSSQFKGDCWELVEHSRRQMSWGSADIFMHRKL